MAIINLTNGPTPLPALAGTLGGYTVATIAALKTVSVTGLPNNTVVETMGYYAANDGGNGVYAYNSASSAIDNGGTVIAPTIGSGRWLLVYNNYLTVKQFGGVGDGSTDDAAAFQAAMTVCQTVNIDLVVAASTGGNYIIKSGLNWNCRRYNILGSGDPTIDFTLLPSGYGITVFGDNNSSGNIWHSSTKRISGIVFEGTTSVGCINITGVTNFSVPAFTIEFCFFDVFDKHILFGDETWVVNFHRCFFRNGNKQVVFNTVNNAGENIQFTGCTFSGGGITISHEGGSVESKFIDCSFDYCQSVLTTTAVARGKMVFIGCHFETNAFKHFNVNCGSSAYYIDIMGSDWYFVNAIPDTIGTFYSTNSAAQLNITNNEFPLFTTGQDRSYATVIDIGSGSAFKLNAQGNSIESSNNSLFSTFANSGQYPAFTSGNTGSSMFSFNGGGSIFPDTGAPTGLPTGSAPNTWRVSGARTFWTYVPYDPASRASFAGWINRSNGGYTAEARYFSITGTQLAVETLAIPGALSGWVKFGQFINPPQTTAYFRAGINAGGSVTTADNCYVNGWMYNQF